VTTNGDARLEALAKHLGASAGERLDVAATAHKVVERLRERPVRRVVWIQQTWLRVAATVVVLIGGSFALMRVTHPPYPSGVDQHGTHFVADDLNDLSTDQLRDVLTTFDEVVSSDSSAVPESSPDLHELDARQLRAMLRSLEG
jgi:hypothetical protein